MTLVNKWLREIFDALTPLRPLPPIVALLILSLVTSAGALLLFKATSDQAGLAAVKRRIHACLFEIRLLRDDARGILRAQGEMLLQQAVYLRFAGLPMLLMVALLLPAMAQLQFRYGYRGLDPGQEFIVKVRLRDDWRASSGASRPDARLEVPAGLTVRTPGLWIASLRELAWRVRAERRGGYRLSVRLGGETLQKTVDVSSGPGLRSPVRLAPGLANQILYPAEDPLPEESAATSIAVGYASGSVPVFGWRLHWLVVFLAFSVACTLALRGPMRVVL